MKQDTIIPVLKDAVLSGLVFQAARRARSAEVAGIVMLVASVLACVTGLGFAVAALYGWLALSYAPHLALAATALVLILLSAVFLYIGLRRMRQNRRVEIMRTQQETEKLIAGLANGALQEIEQPTRENPKTALAVAAIAGFIAGETIR